MKWNSLNLPEECDYEAKEGIDREFFYGGFAFLVNLNGNVICLRYKKSKTTFKEALRRFLKFCVTNEIQYLRVEGNCKRYNFLMNPHLFPRLKNKGLDVKKHFTESERLGRNVFYVKVY